MMVYFGRQQQSVRKVEAAGADLSDGHDGGHGAAPRIRQHAGRAVRDGRHRRVAGAQVDAHHGIGDL